MTLSNLRKKEVEITVTDQFQEAFDLLENTSKNLFITGKAGTGKTTFLEHFRKNTKKKIAVVAPTGIAAINVRGQTIHSFFRFKPRFIDTSTIGKARKDLRKLYNKLDVLVIDEISMVRADLFDAIEAFMKINGKDPNKPFGGCQICIIGDLFQLPPVLTQEENDIFYDRYDNPFFFGAKSFQKEDFSFIEFTKIFRQSEQVFINLLNKIRDNSLDKEALELINQRVDSCRDQDDAIILSSTNRIADIINQQRLDKIKLPEYEFKAEVTGEFEQASQVPAPTELVLKEGAQVMFLKNDLSKRWVNGTIGKVSRISGNSIFVIVDENEFEVPQDKWELIKYEYSEEKGEIAEVVKGSFKQFPLQLAWAITIHKSQSKTFDKVIVDLGNGAFASGQAYVALSRCRTFNGLKLTRPLKTSDIICDNSITEFLKGF